MDPYKDYKALHFNISGCLFILDLILAVNLCVVNDNWKLEPDGLYII